MQLLINLCLALYEIAKGMFAVKEFWYLIGIMAILFVYKGWRNFKQKL